MVVQRPNAGVLLSMPATAPDISSHKLVNVEPSNSQRGLPTIHGLVTVFDTETGKPICLLDGPEVTGARTAAVSMIGIETFLDNTPKKVLIIGTGAQAQYHIRALNDVYPDAEIYVRGIDKESAEDFCKSNEGNSHLIACDPDYIPEDVDVVILLTTSTKPIYNFSGKSGRLIIGVGAFKPEMAEIGKETLFSSNVFVDDFAGAKEEAGDLIQANVDWSSVKGLALALTSKVDKKEPFVFKTVGTGAWDLAASNKTLFKLPGRPKAIKGIIAPPIVALFADSEETTPSSQPVPNRSGVLDTALEVEYATIEPITAPTPGNKPIHVPITEDLSRLIP
jgi:1-piperideine-2-carboxylate/1-pyrroline-2-carboxylate reductase [NAD(P)H]